MQCLIGCLLLSNQASLIVATAPRIALYTSVDDVLIIQVEYWRCVSLAVSVTRLRHASRLHEHVTRDRIYNLNMNISVSVLISQSLQIQLRVTV